MTKNLRALLVLIFLASMAIPSDTAAQVPDLSKLPAYPDKMKAWNGYCDSLRLNTAGGMNNYVLLEQSALKGIQLAKADDTENRIKFFTYAALGYYYQIKFDSAQYYFYQSLDEAQKAHFTKQIAKACVSLIPVNFQLQQMDKVEQCKNILQSIVDTTKDRSIQEDGYYALGSYFQQKSYYSTAQDYFIKSIELREKEVDTSADIQKKFAFAIQ